MASLRGKSQFITVVAEEIACGIDGALRYWLGRIELEVIDRSLTPEERLYAIEQILTEYKVRASDLAEGHSSPAAGLDEQCRSGFTSRLGAKP